MVCNNLTGYGSIGGLDIIIGVMLFIASLSPIIIVIGICLTVSNKVFKAKSKKITVGISKQEVMKIMGRPTGEGVEADGKSLLIWEKTKWRGLWGNLRSKVKAQIENGKVTAVFTENIN